MVTEDWLGDLVRGGSRGLSTEPGIVTQCMFVTFTSLSLLLLREGRGGRGIDVTVTLSCCHQHVLEAPGALLATAVAASRSSHTWAGFLQMHN